MAVCNGRGNGGTHCCWIEGKECEYLIYEGDLGRCSVWDEMDTPEWHESLIGRMFMKWYGDPNLTCRDYPQNIPDFPEGGRCCWKGRMHEAGT